MIQEEIGARQIIAIIPGDAVGEWVVNVGRRQARARIVAPNGKPILI